MNFILVVLVCQRSILFAWFKEISLTRELNKGDCCLVSGLFYTLVDKRKVKYHFLSTNQQYLIHNRALNKECRLMSNYRDSNVMNH